MLAVFVATGCSTLTPSTSALRYEPSVVRIAGSIERATFPGRLNYEDTAAGDEPEPYWILHLDSPVKVIGSDPEMLNVTEDKISEMQLVFMSGERQYAKYRNLVSLHVIVTGTLYHATTGHHHTTVLITVKKINRMPDR